MLRVTRLCAVKFAVAAATGATVLSGCVAPSSGPAPTKTTTVTVTDHDSAAAQAQTPAPAPTATTFMNTDGTYVIGKDIEPGTYKSAPTLKNDYPFCTWKRLSGFSGLMEDTIAIANQPGQTIVTISPSDIAFYTSSCQPWEKIS